MLSCRSATPLRCKSAAVRVGAVSFTAALPQLLALAALRGGGPRQRQASVHKPRPARAARQLPLWLLPARLEVWFPFFFFCIMPMELSTLIPIN